MYARREILYGERAAYYAARSICAWIRRRGELCKGLSLWRSGYIDTPSLSCKRSPSLYFPSALSYIPPRQECIMLMAHDAVFERAMELRRKRERERVMRREVYKKFSRKPRPKMPRYLALSLLSSMGFTHNCMTWR